MTFMMKFIMHNACTTCEDSLGCPFILHVRPDGSVQGNAIICSYAGPVSHVPFIYATALP
jgi:hypothetical protein